MSSNSKISDKKPVKNAEPSEYQEACPNYIAEGKKSSARLINIIVGVFLGLAAAILLKLRVNLNYLMKE
jgi:hypothetical protein